MALSLRLSSSYLGLRHADDHGASARQFFVRNFGYELQVEAETLAFLTGHIVEKVNYISSESILGAAPFIEVEGAGRIYFQSICILQRAAELTLELKCALPDLRHGESHNMI